MYATFHICNKGIILSDSAQNCFSLGFISEKNAEIGFMSVDIRTTFLQYLKGFLKKNKNSQPPHCLIFLLMLPPTDNFLRMASIYWVKKLLGC